jgi:hypothetical protein
MYQLIAVAAIGTNTGVLALVGPAYLVAGHSIGKSLIFGSVFTVLMFAFWIGLAFAYRTIFMRPRSQRDGSDN